MRTVWILFVVSIESTAILKGMVLGRCLDPMVELDVRQTDDCVADELGYDCIVGYSAKDDRRKRLNS